ncbi:MAG: tRNA-intron lyase [Candidatus Micrarchaeota archaeon]|nr:tRNA-intron lyase [Candidatus Micrarchaeota archaeon]
MPIEIEFFEEDKKFVVGDPSSVSSLRKSFYGENEGAVVFLRPEEALYMLDVRNGRCLDENGREVTFNRVASYFEGSPRLMTRYYAYKDWRDRGLVIRPVSEAVGNYSRSPVHKYPSPGFSVPVYHATARFYPDDGFAVIDDNLKGEQMYREHWFGQYGTYKTNEHGKFSKLDIYETIFLLKNGSIEVENADVDALMSAGKHSNSFFEPIYNVYEDWRMRGFVVKTGFKFGTHFRIYFPGASPARETDDWIHSKHVLHVFPRNMELLTSELSRAIRVAHSVKKTFILAMPGEGEPRIVEPDYLLYHRKSGGIETPDGGKPKYLMLSLNEDERISGEYLAGAILAAERMGLNLVLAMVDRETSVTYYRVRKIELKGSKYEYFEIDWIQP